MLQTDQRFALDVTNVCFPVLGNQADCEADGKKGRQTKRQTVSYLCVRLATDVTDVRLQVLGVRVLGDVLPQTLQITTSALSTR